MGEAKRRGTFEQRKATAKTPKASNEERRKVTITNPKTAAIMFLADVLADSLEYRTLICTGQHSRFRFIPNRGKGN